MQVPTESRRGSEEQERAAGRGELKKKSPNESFLCANSLLRWPAYLCLQVVSI